MKKKIIMKLEALFMTGILVAEATCTGIGANTVYAAETDAVESESDGADTEFTGASGTNWTLDADGLLTISGDPEYEEFKKNYEDESYIFYLPEWYNYREKITKVKVEAFKSKKTEYWFYNCDNLISISFADGFDTSSVTNMNRMFSGCSSLTSLDLSGWDTSDVSDMDEMFSHCRRLTSLDLSSMDTSSVTNMNSMFYACSNLTSLDVSGWDTSNVSEMSGMFSGCSSLTSLDVSDWDTSNVTEMLEMFSTCSSLTSLDLSGWDTSNVTDMNKMFSGCSGLTSLDVSIFDTSNVTSMGSMFYCCSGLTSLDVSIFDTSNVTSMGGMFSGCSSLTSLDVSGWDTSNVTFMASMFSGCSSLTSLDVSGWDTSNVTSMGLMFSGCSSLTSLDVSGWDTSNVTSSMNGMFSGCSSLTSLDVSGWDTSYVTSMGYMFSSCSGLTSLDLKGWDTSNVRDMWYMFSGCSSLTSLDVSGWDTSNVTNMDYMFSGCSSLTSLDVSSWDTSNVTNILCMFSDCSSLTSLDLSGWDTSNVRDMWYMFAGCSSLTSLDVSDWDTSNVTKMIEMFSTCSSLTSLDVSDWDISNVTSMGAMFSGCSSLTSLDVSGWDTSNVTHMGYMFQGCSGLTNLDLSGWDTSNVRDMWYMFSGCSSLTSLDLSGWDTSNVTTMDGMFQACSGLTSLDVSGWDTSNVISIEWMFSSCYRMERIKPFVEFNKDLELPLKMYDLNGAAYTTFPQGLTEPKTLYSSVPTASSATSVSMNKRVLSIDFEKRYKLSYKYAPLDCTDEPVWTSSDSSVVSVNSVGMISSHSKEGTAVITVSLGSCSDSCEVTVRKAVTPDETYSIIFDANGGSGSMSPLTVSVGKEITLSQNTFEKADNSFLSWNTSADGSGTSYADKAKVKDLAQADGSITLYAQWEKTTPEPTGIKLDIPTATPTPTTTSTSTAAATPTPTVSDPSVSENDMDILTVTPTPTAIPTTIPEFDNGDTISTKSISGLPKGTQTMDAGGSVNLKAVVTTADGANGSATWIAPVGHVLDAVPQEDGSLEIKAIGPGTAYVTVVSGTKTKTVKYTVKQAVKTVDTSVNAITLGTSEKYRLCVIPDVPTTDKFYFESSDKNICSVDQKGLIKAKKKEGSATITVYAYDKNSEKKNRPVASLTVNVESKDAPAVSVTDASINYLGNKELYVGEMGYISTLVNGGANNGGVAVKYTMDNKGIVKIDTYGHVTAKKAGTVTITATCGGMVDSVTLTVKQPLKLYKVNKSYVKVVAPKEGNSSKKVTFTVRTNPTAKKFIDSGGKVIWTVTSKDTGISLKSDDGKGKAVFEVPSSASDTIVTATISDSVTGKIYNVDCMIDVRR